MKKSTYSKETMSIARTIKIRQAFLEEVDRLLKSGAIDFENHSRGLLFGVALENLSDNWLNGERKTKEYKNLKNF